MDPLTCLSLASSIAQLVDFTSTLISGSKEIYDSVSGTTKENDELDIVIRDLSHLCSNLQSAPPTGLRKSPLSDDEKALQPIAVLCKDVADEILGVLGKLKVEGKHLKWKALYGAIKTVTGKEKMRSLQERLARA